MSEFDARNEWLGERPPRRQAMGDLEMSGGTGARGDAPVGLDAADPYSESAGPTADESAPDADAGSGGRRTGKRLAY